MAKIIQLTECWCDAYIDSLEGKYIDEESYETLYGGEDIDIYKPDRSLLLSLRRRELPRDVCDAAYLALLRAAVPSLNRGMAAGGRKRRRKRDGTLRSISSNSC